jgi:hypothetical protein
MGIVVGQQVQLQCGREGSDVTPCHKGHVHPTTLISVAVFFSRIGSIV